MNRTAWLPAHRGGGGPWLHLLRKSYLSLPQTHPKPPKPDRNVKGFRINW